METKFQKIEVTRAFAYDVNKWIDIDEPKPLEPGESDVVTMTARFDDGIEAVIKVFYGQSDCCNNTYIDAILLEDGCEVDNANPIEDTLLREFYFYHKKVAYVVDVVLKDESQNEPIVKESPDVKRKCRTIFVTRDEAESIQEYLDADNGTMVHEIAPSADILEADFGDGLTAEIRICYEHDTNFINPIFYLNKIEVQSLDYEYFLLGEFEFNHEGVEYVVSVELEPRAS